MIQLALKEHDRQVEELDEHVLTDDRQTLSDAIEDIVDAYAEYDADSRKRVILLSNDHGFVERAREQGVLAQHVSFPVDIPRKVTVSWDEPRDVLYTLAVLFGVLQLPKVTLYGVWNGKSGEDWQRQRLDVDCRSENVEKKLRRDRVITTEYEATR